MCLILLFKHKRNKRHWSWAINRTLPRVSYCLNIHQHSNIVVVKCCSSWARPLAPLCCVPSLRREGGVGTMGGCGVSLGEERRGMQGDDTRVKLKVLVQRTSALWFGIAADVKCDTSVTLTHCQQCLAPLDASPAAGIWPAVWWEVAKTVWCHAVQSSHHWLLAPRPRPLLRSGPKCWDYSAGCQRVCRLCIFSLSELHSSAAQPPLCTWKDVVQFKCKFFSWQETQYLGNIGLTM